MRIFIVNGTPKSGKTSFETMIQNIANQNNYKVAIVSTIDYIKSLAVSLGWDGNKDEASRRMLCELKDTLSKWKDIPYQRVLESIDNFQQLNYDAIFIDSREPAEIKRFVEDFNALTILVQRYNVEFVISNEADNPENIENFDYDIIVSNRRGLVELSEEAEIFFETFIQNKEEIEC